MSNEARIAEKGSVPFPEKRVIRSFRLDEVLPNPFRRLKQHPLDKAKVDAIELSILETKFFNNVPVRINIEGKPEILYGHHRLAALKNLYAHDTAFEWDVITHRDSGPLSDAQMIKAMAHENSTAFNRDPNVLREAINAVVEALAAGKIKPEEMLVADGQGKRSDLIKEVAGRPATSYTVDSLAKFLGQVGADRKATRGFRDMFAALELQAEGWLPESVFTDGRSLANLGEVVSVAKRKREEAAQREADAKAKRLEAERLDAERRELEEAARIRRVQDQESLAKRTEEAAARKRVEAEKLRQEAERRDAVAAQVKTEAKREVHNLADATKSMSREQVKQHVVKQVDPPPVIDEDRETVAQQRLREFRESQQAQRPVHGEAKQQPVVSGLAAIALEIVEAGRRALARKYHPDVEGGSQQKMQEVNQVADAILNSIKGGN